MTKSVNMNDFLFLRMVVKDMSRPRWITAIWVAIVLVSITSISALAQGVKIMDIEKLPEKPRRSHL